MPYALASGAGSVADRKITVLLIHTKTCREKIGWIVDLIGDDSDAVTVSVAGGRNEEEAMERGEAVVFEVAAAQRTGDFNAWGSASAR